MTWFALLLLAAVGYAFKAVGLVIIGRREMRGVLADVVRVIPPALLAALVAVQTFSTGEALVLDARAAGLAFAALSTWRKLPFVVIVVGAAAVSALVRLAVG